MSFTVNGRDGPKRNSYPNNWQEMLVWWVIRHDLCFDLQATSTYAADSNASSRLT